MKKMLNVALPKGRLGEKVYAMFEAAGFECPSIKENNRKLIFENEEAGVRYFWVKPSDVAIYVERGAADIGVAGKDILLEYSPDVYELLDLNLGKCRMAVAAPKGFRDNKARELKVATKFATIAKDTPTARASMLVAIAIVSIVLKPKDESAGQLSPSQASLIMFAPISARRTKATQWSIAVTYFSITGPRSRTGR